jgi:hypothetical protein
VVDPEITDRLFRVREGETVCGFRVGEAGGVEILPMPFDLAQSIQLVKCLGSISLRSTFFPPNSP